MERLSYCTVIFMVIFSFFLVNQFEFEHYQMLNASTESFHSHDWENETLPITVVTVAEEDNLVVKTGTKTVASTEWDIYRVTLQEDGLKTVQFDASGSYDPNHANETDSGIATYEWTVLFDAPYGDWNGEIHTFSYSAEDGATNNPMDSGHTPSPTTPQIRVVRQKIKLESN